MICIQVTQLKPVKNKSEEEAWLDAVESGDLKQVSSIFPFKDGFKLLQLF